jgi:hypothetical protein
MKTKTLSAFATVAAVGILLMGNASAQPKLPQAPLPIQVELEKEGPNLFKNPNFEKGLEGWSMVSFQKKGDMAVDNKELHHGKPSLRIDNPGPDFVFVRQMVGKPNRRYRLTGYVKTKDVEPAKPGAKDGACLMVGFTAEAHPDTTVMVPGTTPWTKMTLDFTTTAKTEIRVGAGLGHYNANVTGTAWFSELSLVELGHK